MSAATKIHTLRILIKAAYNSALEAATREKELQAFYSSLTPDEKDEVKTIYQSAGWSHTLDMSRRLACQRIRTKIGEEFPKEVDP